MLRYGSASAAHSSETTVLPGSYDLSNFSGGRSNLAEMPKRTEALHGLLDIHVGLN